MNDIEILEEFKSRTILYSNVYAIHIEELKKIQQAIENLLKERQVDKDRINILRDKVQENEQTIKDLTNTFVEDKHKYENRIKELETINKMQEYRINEMDIPKTLIEEEINRLKYDVSKIKEIKQTRYSDYDRIRLKAYVTKSNEIIKRLEKCVNKR